jgi:aminoglycoside N3'-acetyltransferase
LRSINPAHPILAFGPDAPWLIADHDKTLYSCGPGSPFEKILQLNAKVLFFDVPLRRMTFFHYLEDVFKDVSPVKLYSDEPVESVVIDSEGKERVVKTYVFSRESRGHRSMRHLAHELIKNQVLKKEKIGHTTLMVVSLQQVVECAQTMVRAGKSLWRM